MSNKIRTKKFDKCPFCSGDLTKKYSGLEDRLYTTKKKFSVSECVDCESALINPMPIGDVSSFYPTNYLSSDSQEVATKKFDLEKWYRYNQYNFDFNLLKKSAGLSLDNATSYIDIGCGSGERVTFAKVTGCKKAYGVDKFDFAKNGLKNEVNIINTEVKDYKPKVKFHVASLFHVMEHIEDSASMLNHIHKHIIQKDGYLIVQVPNYESIERKLFGRKWYGFDVPRHIWQYNQESLTNMITKSGFKVESVYKINASLHPVTIVPTIFRELDIQRIWVNPNSSTTHKRLMTIIWAGFTVLAIPFNIIFNLLNRSTMLTVIAKKV